MENPTSPLGIVRWVVTSMENLRSWDSSSRDDLVSEGLLGLVEAGTRFDESRGIDPWTFALYRVKGRVMDAVRRRSREKLVLGLDVPDGEDGWKHQVGARSAGRLWAEEIENGCNAFTQVPERTMESTLTAREAALLLARCLNALTWRKKQLVVEVGIKKKSMSEASRRLGLSRNKAARLYRSALGEIRRQLLAGGYSLEDFL